MKSMKNRLFKRVLSTSMPLGFLLVSLVALGLGCCNSSQKNGSNLSENKDLSQNRSKQRKFDIESIFNKSNVHPLVIIGSGPAGLTAAIYGAREKLNPLIFKGGEPGGLLMKTTDVTNWPAEKVIVGGDLIEKLNKQVDALGVQWSYDSIESIDVSQWPYALKTDDGDIVYALSVVVATGARSLKLGIPGEDTYWGAGVTTCAICDASLEANKGKVAIVVGGGDSAVEEAMQSAAHQKEVTILVRKDRLRAAATMQEHAKSYSNIKILYNVEVREVLGGKIKKISENEKVHEVLEMSGVRLYNNKTGEESVFPAQMLFLAIGHVPNSEFIKNTLEIDEGGYIKLKGKTQETSIEGIFAAGEIADHRYRQAITSSGDGAKAGLDAVAFLQRIGFNPTISAKLENLKKNEVEKNM